MTPRQFFDEVAEPNARSAIADRGDLQLAVNAIMTLDAVFGILHAALRQADPKAVPERDDAWKGQLASQNNDYRLLRDTAFAIKHGELTQGTRIVCRRISFLQFRVASNPALSAPASIPDRSG